ncbi:hypothetical protein [Falsiroseomonas oryziterrae]|uniref:hypothetical protein n=1 Tax=Falsiroseomonas oryziterrae TaxID=2911368 RepID=UPI001F20E0C1|nr:hypothetical protein [Roseomonas sp. NPKOSM-4]
MKRGRKAHPIAARGISRPLAELAQETLETDYFGFVSNTATEDPKAYIARTAAARAALDHMAALRDLQGAEPEAPEASNDDLLLSARAGMASEDGT